LTNPDLHVVSVSIGSASRDTHQEIELLGRRILIERRGTDGDLEAAGALIRELDGKIDAIGLGGIDMYLIASGRRYYLRDGVRLARNATRTPVVCGAALKDTLERMIVDQLDPLLNWQERKVLMVAGVDRFGMAEALDAKGAEVLYGDLIFSLGLPVRLTRLRHLHIAASILLPVVSRLPISWIYPTGSKQTSSNTNTGREKYFEWADIISGDFHYIRRYAPARLDGKVILTNTTTAQDMEDLRRRGVRTLITTTPRFQGRSIATNLLEAALVACAGKHPLTPEEYRELITTAGLAPDIRELNPASSAGESSGPAATPG
jgi:hypothetical protein